VLKQPRVPAGCWVLPLVGDVDGSCPAAPCVPGRAGSGQEPPAMRRWDRCRLCPWPCGEGERRWFGRVTFFSFDSHPAQAFAFCELGPRLAPLAHVKLRGGFCQRRRAASLPPQRRGRGRGRQLTFL